MTLGSFRIGLSGTEFRGEPIDELVAAADLAGVTELELWCPENLSATGRDSTLARLRQWPGRVAAVSCGVEMAETKDPQQALSSLLVAVELAAEIDAPVVNTYFGSPGFRDDRRSGDLFLRHTAAAFARAEALGVVIVLENEFNAFGRDHVQGDLTRRPEALRSLIQRAGTPALKVNFDAANFYCAGVEPFPYAYEVLADYIEYLHVKDVRIVDSSRADEGDGKWCRYCDYDTSYVTTEMGAGAINWVGLLSRLVTDRYAGTITVEPHARKDHRLAAITQAVAWMRTTVEDRIPEKECHAVQ